MKQERSPGPAGHGRRLLEIGKDILIVFLVLVNGTLAIMCLPTKTLTTKNKKTSARSIRIIAIFFAFATLYCSLTESVFSFFLFISIKLCKKNNSLSNNIFSFVRII